MKNSGRTQGGLPLVNCLIKNYNDLKSSDTSNKTSVKYGKTDKKIVIGDGNYSGYFFGDKKEIEDNIRQGLKNVKKTKNFNIFRNNEYPVLKSLLSISMALDPKSGKIIKQYEKLMKTLTQTVNGYKLESFSNELTKYFITLKSRLGNNFSIGQALKTWQSKKNADIGLNINKLIDVIAKLVDVVSMANLKQFVELEEKIHNESPMYQVEVARTNANNVIKNMDSVIKSLATEYNLVTTVYNRGLSTIRNYDNYVAGKNKKLENQLTNLGNISNKISTRDRLIQINQEQAEINDDRISLLRKVYIPLVVTVIIYVLMTVKKISRNMGFISMFSVLLLYVLYVGYSFNTLSIRKTTNPELEKIRALFDEAERAVDKEAGKIQRKIAEYTDKNCNCPHKKKKKKKSQRVRTGESSDAIVYVNDGVYYYDGTAPSEKMRKDGLLKPVRHEIAWETDKEFGEHRSNILNPPYKIGKRV